LKLRQIRSFSRIFHAPPKKTKIYQNILQDFASSYVFIVEGEFFCRRWLRPITAIAKFPAPATGFGLWGKLGPAGAGFFIWRADPKSNQMPI
jgi:hypothetical protein